jgi:hypothetical protein
MGTLGVLLQVFGNVLSNRHGEQDTVALHELIKQLMSNIKLIGPAPFHVSHKMPLEAIDGGIHISIGGIFENLNLILGKVVEIAARYLVSMDFMEHCFICDINAIIIHLVFLFITIFLVSFIS